MFDAQTGSGSIRVPRMAFGVPPNASSRRQKPNTGIKALFPNALASWTAAALTPLFPGATGRPAQSADLSAHSKNLSGHPVNKSASFCAIYDLLPSPNATRVMGITCKFRIRKNAQNFSFKTSWRSSTCENPPQVNKGNWAQKNSEFFSGHFYRKTLANQRKMAKKTAQNHAKKSRFLMRFFHHYFINKSQSSSANCPIVASNPAKMNQSAFPSHSLPRRSEAGQNGIRNQLPT